MRKLIAILLIAAIACTELDTTPKVEEPEFKELLDLLDVDLDSIELSWLGNIFKGIGNFFKGVWNGIKSGIQWLKDKGIWNTVVSLAKTGGKLLATGFCSRYLPSNVCKPAVDGIFKLF